MSAWITVAITFERLLAVTKPLKVAMLSTPCRARLLLTVLCVVCASLTAYPMWTVGTDVQDGDILCLITNQVTYDSWYRATFIIGNLVVPEVLLIAFSLVIIVQLARSRRLRQQV
jgi:hypothetical protein